jgi:hypothetical protein
MCLNVETIRVTVCGATDTRIESNDDHTIIDLIAINSEGAEKKYFSVYTAVPYHHNKEKAECA